MANLEWPGQMLLVSAIATLAFVFLSYWFSHTMTSRGWTLQVRSKPKKKAKQAKKADQADKTSK